MTGSVVSAPLDAGVGLLPTLSSLNWVSVCSKLFHEGCPFQLSNTLAVVESCLSWDVSVYLL